MLRAAHRACYYRKFWFLGLFGLVAFALRSTTLCAIYAIVWCMMWWCDDVVMCGVWCELVGAAVCMCVWCGVCARVRQCACYGVRSVHVRVYGVASVQVRKCVNVVLLVVENVRAWRYVWSDCEGMRAVGCAMSTCCRRCWSSNLSICLAICFFSFNKYPKIHSLQNKWPCGLIPSKCQLKSGAGMQLTNTLDQQLGGGTENNDQSSL